MKGNYLYILTNKYKTVTYTGVTSDLKGRLLKHINKVYKGFTSKYNCHDLVYFEKQQSMEDAIRREKEVKKWGKRKKKALIESFNPEWEFLNDQVLNSSMETTEMNNNIVVIPTKGRNLQDQT
ncbi:MAG: GIY-YIG nuclease family protein [Flavobacteriales bacterium]|nr:GIY-YIG nuclease family protein [Flavobacteriales bacterium]